MSTRVLRLDSSLFGADGASYQLNDLLVETLQQRLPGLQVTRRDLAAEPLPYVTAEFLQALGKGRAERTEEEERWVALSDQLIRELREADILIIAAPMYNFTIPSTLKTWMDHVARAGDTFRYTENGPEGLVGSKKVYVTTSRGGMHKGQTTDGIVPLLTSFLSLLGLTDVEFIYAEGLNMAGQRDQALAQARRSIETLAA